MSNQSVVRTPALKPSLILLWLGMGLAFQIVYFGLPHPLRIGTWLHVVFWPAYVLLGMARWVFYPFAMIAMLGFAVMFFFNGRR